MRPRRSRRLNHEPIVCTGLQDAESTQRKIGKKRRKWIKPRRTPPRQRDVNNDGEKDDEKHGAKTNRRTNEQTSEDERREEEESGLRKSKQQQTLKSWLCLPITQSVMHRLVNYFQPDDRSTGRSIGSSESVL
ncbi:hypothetical protein WN51_00568 [Melipona quadrifasciata]|uniref:Uncharacterized protein n=1 Tax=Melipona quadrifasciata TaxID=166423 RepID=A0A0M9A2I4_9HYME|nr:hypothetical protein WN51_00568 [Melipona quadrifasciata]